MEKSAHPAPSFHGLKNVVANNFLENIDWANSPFGAQASWSTPLRNTVRTLELSRDPMFFCWHGEPAILINQLFALAPVFQGVVKDINVLQTWLYQQLPMEELFSGISRIVELTWDRTPQGTAALVPVFDEAGAVIGVIGTLISTKSPASVHHDDQKTFLDSILDASFHAIYALKAERDHAGLIQDFRYMFINNVAAANFSMSPDEIVGQSMLSLLPVNRDNGFFDLFCATLNGQKPLNDETFFQSSVFSGWFSYVVVPIDSDTLVVTAQDITSQKNATQEITRQNELLDLIIENAPTALAFCESIRDDHGSIVDFKIVLANTKAAEYTGFTHEEFTKLTIKQVHQINHAVGITEKCIRVAETGTPTDFEYFLSRRNVWLRVNIVKVKDGFLSVYNDITPIKNLQIEQEKLLEELRRTNINLEEFTYAASHDLKEPVRKIYFFVDHLKESLSKKLSSDEAYTFERMALAARRMNSLIDDLLTYSRVSAGKEDTAVVDLNELIKLVLNDLDIEIEQRGATVSVGLLPEVKGNHRQLQQAFLNLIGNSLKYSRPEVPPVIRLSADNATGRATDFGFESESGDKQYHAIRIHDNGIGFEQSEAEKIFQVFTRLHGNDVFKGTGVGLTIVRKIIENHNGLIRAEGTRGIGAVFIILLPAL